MPNQGVPVIFKNKIAYGYAEKSVQAYDVSVSDYNALTEQQQLDGSIRFIQGVDAIPNGSNVWAKLGTTPLAEGLPRDCSQAVNQLKSNLTDLIAKFGTVTEDTITASTGGSGIININIPKNSIMLAVCPSPDGERCVIQRGFNPNYNTTQARYTYNVYTIYNSGSHYFLDKVFNTSVTFKYYYVTITA